MQTISMSQEHRRHLYEQFIGGVVINFAINAVIGWVIFRGAESAPFFGMTSILGDTLAMGFLLPFFLCLFVTLDTRKKMRAGRFSVLRDFGKRGAVHGRLPDGILKRSIFLGVLGLVSVLPVLAVVYYGLAKPDMALWNFVWFKGGLAAVMAVPLIPLVVMRAFADDLA